MFVRHKERAAGKDKKYDAFKERYYSFHPDDICTLCENCHKAIHAIYYPVILKHVRRLAPKPVSKWTWRQVDILIRDLTKICESWLTN